MNESEKIELLSNFRKPLINNIINYLEISPGSQGIDIGCGTGQLTKILADKSGKEGKITGLDYSKEMINYARAKTKNKNIQFSQGDVNKLGYGAESFDWIWSMDTIWAGPKELGCPADDPDKILKQLFKILKPGGDIYLSFWTSQKLLPGFPLLEAKLNASASSNAPYFEGMNPYIHIMNGKKWLKKANFDCIQEKSFIYDINGPLNDDDKKALTLLFQMLWGKASDHLSREEWEIFTALTNPDSKKFLPGDPDYYAFFTYTLFHGIKK